MVQIWYLTPFLLAWLAWWVATRRHPEDKDRWTWAACGVTGGGVVVFLMIYVSEWRSASRPDSEPQSITTNEPRLGTTLQGDSSVEVLSPTRIRVDRGLTVGSLQIVLVGAKDEEAGIQLEPASEIEHFAMQEWFDRKLADSTTSQLRLNIGTTLGSNFSFAYHGRVYRLDLLEIQKPMTGLNRRPVREWFDLHAVIRLLDTGAYSECHRTWGNTDLNPRTLTNNNANMNTITSTGGGRISGGTQARGC